MNALRVAERLDPAEFDLSIACFRGDGRLRPRFDAAGVPVDEFPVRSLYRASMVTQGMHFMRFLQRERVDVVHAHDRYANIFAVPWARLAGTRAVIASKRWGSIGRAHGIGIGLPSASLIGCSQTAPGWAIRWCLKVCPLHAWSSYRISSTMRRSLSPRTIGCGKCAARSTCRRERSSWVSSPISAPSRTIGSCWTRCRGFGLDSRTRFS
jgi:hypothetical protein